MTQTSVFLGIAFLLFTVLLLATALVLLRPTQEAQYLEKAIGTRPRHLSSASSHGRVEDKLLHLAAGLRIRLGLNLSPISLNRLEMAGYRTPLASEAYFAICWLTPLFGAFLGSFVPANTLFVAFTLTVTGYLAPGLVLSSLVRRRQGRIQRSLPDFIDLLVICMDAGLGMDQAMLRVNNEIALSHPDIHAEMKRLIAEQRAGKRRLEAWEDLTTRLPLDEVKMLGTMLAQAERFGSPLAKSMSRYAEDLRLRRRQRAEEAAAKTKIKIIFPLVFFIFPSLLIVLLAPALLGVFRDLKGLAP